MTQTLIEIPAELKPADGRFGSGPSRVRREQLEHLVGEGAAVMGTSHRQKPVRQLVARTRAGLRELFALPDGYEIALGNGGTTVFWDAATSCIVRDRALHLTYGEFSSKFAACTGAAPFLRKPIVVEAEPGDAPDPAAAHTAEPVDVIGWAQRRAPGAATAAPQRETSPSRENHLEACGPGNGGIGRAHARRRSDRPRPPGDARRGRPAPASVARTRA